MRLHENKDLFKDAVRITAQQINLPEIYIEKDYWVTYVLFRIFSSPIANETVFKGGTGLSKCFTFIKRFSEDIDLVVLRTDKENPNQLKSKLRQITQLVTDVLPEIFKEDITNKKGMIRKTAHTYAREFEGDFGQVRDIIIIESTWLGYYEPYTTKPVSSFIYEMMLATEQKPLAEEYGMLPFDVLVLEPSRTICEKIMSLVRFSHTKEPLEDLKKKIRHTYDLHMLLQENDLLKFFNSEAFDEMLLKVANDDVLSFKNNNDWLKFHPKDAIAFADIDNIWNDLKLVYNGEFRSLIFGEEPDDQKVLETLKLIAGRLVSVNWNINIKK